MGDYKIITELFDSWPERVTIPIRLHLYDVSKKYRCSLEQLACVFELADKFGVQTRVSTNLNRLNAVYVELDNYVLIHRDSDHAVKGSWGNHYGFLLALADELYGNVFVDDPTGETVNRYCIDEAGNITEIIETSDDC